MDENQNEQVNEERNNATDEQNTGSANTFSFSADDIKKETAQTVKQVKDSFKNTDIKNDTAVAKGFFVNFFKDPIEQIKKCANDSKANFLKIAIILLVIWLVAILVKQIAGIASVYLFGHLGSFSYFFQHLLPNMLDVIKAIIAPVIGIAVLSGLVYGFKKNKDKSFLSIVSAIVIANIPVIITNVVNLLTIFSNNISKLTSYFSSFCNILYAVLLYFAIKYLSNESEDKSSFIKFALIIGIYYIIKFAFSYLGIYI